VHEARHPLARCRRRCRRATAIGPKLQGRRQTAFAWIAQLLGEVIGCNAAGQVVGAAAGAGGNESIGIGAESSVIHALKLNREIGRAAIVLRKKSVGLAAGGAADLHHAHADALQTIDDRFTGRAGAAGGDNVDGG